MRNDPLTGLTSKRLPQYHSPSLLCVRATSCSRKSVSRTLIQIVVRFMEMELVRINQFFSQRFVNFCPRPKHT